MLVLQVAAAALGEQGDEERLSFSSRRLLFLVALSSAVLGVVERGEKREQGQQRKNRF
jgi:hypothetical protein